MTPLEIAEPEAIEQLRKRLGDRVRTTPVWEWESEGSRLGISPLEIWVKLELLQYAGSFKIRGALAVMDSLTPETLRRGVVTVSAGNHAMAVSLAARQSACSAKVVMPKTVNPARISGCRALGAEVLLTEDVHQAFSLVRELEEQEGRTFIHPFEGPRICLGTATVGWEMTEQVPPLDVMVVPVGGGGLLAGVSTAIKARWPGCRVIGVEPEGADTLHRSFASGQPESIDRVNTIADSLGAPHAAPYSLEICQRHVDQLVRVSDDQMCAGMALLFEELKLVTEPAGAATTAALWGPLRQQLIGKRVGLIVCGANIDIDNFSRYVTRGTKVLARDGNPR